MWTATIFRLWCDEHLKQKTSTTHPLHCFWWQALESLLSRPDSSLLSELGKDMTVHWRGHGSDCAERSGEIWGYIMSSVSCQHPIAVRRLRLVERSEDCRGWNRFSGSIDAQSTHILICNVAVFLLLHRSQEHIIVKSIWSSTAVDRFSYAYITFIWIVLKVF